nr:MAG TPA: hypothetical protein [Caudoviricetes sp.]
MINFILGILVMYILASITVAIMDNTEYRKLYNAIMWMYCWWMVLFLVVCGLTERIKLNIYDWIKSRKKE